MERSRASVVRRQEAVKRNEYWKERSKLFKPTKAQLRTGSSYYEGLMKKYRAGEHGLRFVSGFRPVVVKAKHWFALSAGGAGESYIVRLVSGKGAEKSGENRLIFWATLSFEPKGVVIESLQGRKGIFGLLSEFRGAVGMHHADFVVSEIELQAKRMGYKKVFLPVPEELDYYRTPYEDKYQFEAALGTRRLREEVPEERARIGHIRENIKKLYYGVIQNRGFVREGSRFAKEL